MTNNKSFNKKDAIRIITKSAKLYEKNLLNTNILFCFNIEKKTEMFEATFLKRNFLHLTGINITNPQIKSSTLFFNRCVNSELNESDLSFASNNTTQYKLFILEKLMSIHTSAKMVGDYNFTKSLLQTDKVTGSTIACLGFVREDQYFVPNTSLYEDIRNITLKPVGKVIAIYQKEIEYPYYNTMTYVAKGIDPYTIKLPKEIMNKLDLQHMQYDFIKSEPKSAPEANSNHKGLSKEKAVEMLKEAGYPPNHKLVNDLVKLGDGYSFHTIKELKEHCKDVKELIHDFQKVEQEMYHHQEPEDR